MKNGWMIGLQIGLIIGGSMLILGGCGGLEQGTFTTGGAILRCIFGGIMGLTGLVLHMEERFG